VSRTEPAGLRAALARGRVVLPGCHDPLSARLAAEAGARAVFLAGSAVGRALFDEADVPTRGASTYLRYVELVCTASPVPVVVDGEEGFGDPVGTARALARAGAAGIAVGDGGAPGFADIVSAIRAATDLVVVARADGLGAGADPAPTAALLRAYRAAAAELVLPLLSRVPADRLAAVLAALATDGLAVHARRTETLPTALPSEVAAVLVTGVSVPTSHTHLSAVLAVLSAF